MSAQGLQGLSLQDFNRISFDLTTLAERLAAAEDWGKLVVAHIYLDHILTQSLRDHVANMDAYFKGGHKSFADKLALCEAHDLLDADLSSTLTAINSARNKFAHRLVFEVPDDLKVRLFTGFSPNRVSSDVLGPEGFTDFLFTVVMLLEFARIFGLKIAELEREKASYQSRILQLAKEIVGPRQKVVP